MQHFHGRPEIRDRKEETRRVHNNTNQQQRERRLGGEPAKYNTRSEERRIVWENDLYERQSI
ncbi:MAG: hypothetical protein ICV66_14085 [Chitinophagaceae bacterium]|nr:hypothetical protein [Chitinophagaceae bacterium]